MEEQDYQTDGLIQDVVDLEIKLGQARAELARIKLQRNLAWYRLSEIARVFAEDKDVNQMWKYVSQHLKDVDQSGYKSD